MRSLKLLLCHQLSVLVPCFLCSYLEQCPASIMWLSPLLHNSHRINNLQSGSVMLKWGVQTYFNVLSTPHRWSWQLERWRSITSLGSELIVALVLAYKIFTADMSSHRTRKSERVICLSVNLQSRAFGFISSIVKLIHQRCRQLYNRVSTLVINLTLFVCHDGRQDKTGFLFLQALHVTSSQDDRLRTEKLGSIPGRDTDLFVLR